MPRKPAPLELVGGRGPRQRIWDAIRAKAGAEWTNYDIARAADADDETAYTYIRALTKAGLVEEVRLERRSRVASVVYRRLVRDCGAEAPRLKRDGRPVTMGLPQEQMWRTLRMLKGDTNARELAAHASTADIPVRETAAVDYLRNLHLANYLRCTKPGKGTGKGGIQARYQLVTNTGPRPPMVCRTDAIYDPNLGKTVWVKPITEEDAIYG